MASLTDSAVRFPAHTYPTPAIADAVAGVGEASPHRVVIVGGGFGGLSAVRALRHAPVDVTLIDSRNFHLFEPLLYQVATGALSAAEVATPLRGIVKRQRNARVLLGRGGGHRRRPPPRRPRAASRTARRAPRSPTTR